MTRVKISLLVEVEYDLVPDYYVEGSTPEQMLAIDIMGAEEDPYVFMDRKDAKLTVTGEIVK